jgi:hypothetical protein
MPGRMNRDFNAGGFGLLNISIGKELGRKLLYLKQVSVIGNSHAKLIGPDLGHV